MWQISLCFLIYTVCVWIAAIILIPMPKPHDKAELE